MLRHVESIREGPRTIQQPQTGSLPSAGRPHSHAPQTQNLGPQQMAAQAAGNPPGPAPAVPQPAARTIVNPLRQIVQRQTRDLQETLGDVRTDTADEIVDLRGAVQEISQQNDLSAAELQTLLTNLEGGPEGNPPPAPLTAQLFAQGRLRARQLLNPAEVQSYETALRNRRVSKEKSGTEQRAVSQRLAAQPVLTRYVQEPDFRHFTADGGCTQVQAAKICWTDVLRTCAQIVSHRLSDEAESRMHETGSRIMNTSAGMHRYVRIL